MMEEPNTGSVGWRFSPKDEELINYFLARKINGREDDVKVIREIDVCKWEPSDLPGKSVLKSDDKEWFFFCPRDNKLPSSSRSKRATKNGFWKATGKDRKIRSKNKEIGFKKTLVYYTGRVSKSERTYWVMHEYRATLKELDGTHPGQRPFVLCRLFKRDDDFVLDATDNDVELGTPSRISNEQFPVGSNLEPMSHQVELSAGQDGEIIRMRAENKKDNSFVTPIKDTINDTRRRVNYYPADAMDLEDIANFIPIEHTTSSDTWNFFVGLDPNGISLSDSPLLMSMGSSLPANNVNRNEDLQIDYDHTELDHTYDVIQSLLENSSTNIFENEYHSRISTVDQKTPNNDHMDHYEIPCIANGSYSKSNDVEAELSTCFAVFEQHGYVGESTWSSFQEPDESQTHFENQRNALSGSSVLENCVFADEFAPSSLTDLNQADQYSDSWIQTRHRQLQNTPAISNFDKHGTAQRRIHLQNHGRRSYELQGQNISDLEDEEGDDVFILQSSAGTEIRVPKNKKPTIDRKHVTSVVSSFHRPQRHTSRKLIVVLASIAIIFLAYAAIHGYLWKIKVVVAQEPHLNPRVPSQAFPDI